LGRIQTKHYVLSLTIALLEILMPNSLPPNNTTTNSFSSASGYTVPLLALGGSALVFSALIVLFIKTWYKNPAMLSKKSLMKLLRIQRVLESDIKRHQISFTALSSLVDKANILNSEKFQNDEFLVFSKIKSCIAHGVNEYTDLNTVVDLLSVAIKTQKSFSIVYQVESQYHSGNQQKLYDFVTNLLNQEPLDGLIFKEQVSRKAEEICLLLKTDEGKKAITSYAVELAKVAEHEFGLSLLRLFKNSKMSDYSLIREIGESVEKLQGKDLLNLDGLMMLILEKPHVFEKIGAILGLKEEANTLETHRDALQYMGLRERHQASYGKFQELLGVVKEFHRYYKLITEIRVKYPNENYRLPKELKLELPGLKLYNKYMVIKTTGYVDKPVDQHTELATRAAAVNDESKKLFKNNWNRAIISNMAIN
jgi:hypothetical protein